jgi:hypothetical protein
MKRRFTIDGNGDLVDREGNVLGKVVGITIEGPAVGDIGGSSSLSSTDNDELQLRPPSPQDRELIEGFGKLGGRKLPPTERWLLTAAVNAVWGHYAGVMKPRSDAPDDEQRKIIRLALDVATVAECKKAIGACRTSSRASAAAVRHGSRSTCSSK